MTTRGLLVRLEAKPGKYTEVEEFLRSALAAVLQEPATTAWFAIRFGRAEYGIFDVFPDDAGRDAHLSGPVASALMEQADTLLVEPPRIQKVDVLADKLPAPGTLAPVSKALLLTLKAKSGHEPQVEQFLRDARPMVEEEADTTAWFAIRIDGEHYGIFDVFPDNGGRFAHLVGQVPRELAKHALSLLGGVPDLEMIDVLAHKMP